MQTATSDLQVRSIFSLHFLLNAVRAFYERNLFERIIIYVFLSAFLVKVIFELILGEWSFVQSQNKQWFFYGFLALDYLISARKVVNIRVSFNMMFLYAFVFLIMVFHGIFVGVINHNPKFEILNDTIPLLMIALNILRFQSIEEYKKVDFRFLLSACTLLSLGTTIIGFLGQVIGNPTQPSIGNITIFLPVLVTALFMLRPFPKWVAVSSVIMIVMSMSDFNRTSLAFLGASVGVFTLITLIKKPVFGIAACMFLIMVLSLGWATLPEDSKTYQRIVGITQIDFTERTGSVGERQAEMDAVQAKLDVMGTSAQWLGMGFGGLYEVHFTHTYMKDYGHAHYSWVWFNLRFGKVGYIYLVILLSALSLNVVWGFRKENTQGTLIALLCLQSLLYCVTYVNAVWLMSGLQFFRDAQK